MTGGPIVIWRFIDGKPGHEKQSLGLAQGLRMLVGNPDETGHVIPAQAGIQPNPWAPASAGATEYASHAPGVACHDIDVRQLARPGLDWLLGRFPAGEALPPPDLLIGAGHATHLPMLAARRAHGGRIVVLMRPSLPLALFDLCLIPAHDQPPARDNVIATLGALNAVTPAGKNDPNRGLILIGGPSAHYGWDDHAVADQVLEIVRRTPDIRWQLTTSRRTPDSFLAGLPLDLPANLTILPHTATPPGWLEKALSESGQAWVSEDSVSMLYEALTAGCAVGLLHLPGQGDSRVSKGVRALIADNWVTPHEEWQNSSHIHTPPGRFDEAGRCARLILDQWPLIAN
jgi:hypothetical protein